MIAAADFTSSAGNGTRVISPHHGQPRHFRRISYGESAMCSMILGMRLPLLLVVLAACGLMAQQINITDRKQDQKMIQSVFVTTNETLLLRLTNGYEGVVRFTHLAPTGVVCEWRFSSRAGSPTARGVECLLEDYVSTPIGAPKYTRDDKGDLRRVDVPTVRVTPRNGEWPRLVVGAISVEWSYGSWTNVWLYYATNRGTIHRLPRKAFDDPVLR
jgi:hypothetical protein